MGYSISYTQNDQTENTYEFCVIASPNKADILMITEVE